MGLLETYGRKAGFSTELSPAWDLMYGDEGLQYLLEAGPATRLAIQLKRGGIILDLSFIQHFTQLFRQHNSSESFNG